MTQSYFSYGFPQFFKPGSGLASIDVAFDLNFRPDYSEGAVVYPTETPLNTGLTLTNLTGGQIFSSTSGNPTTDNLEKAVHYTASYSHEYDMSNHVRNNDCPNITFVTKVSGTLLKPIFVNSKEGITTGANWYFTSGSTSGLASYSFIGLTGSTCTTYSSSLDDWRTQFSASQSSYAQDWSDQITASLSDVASAGSRS